MNDIAVANSRLLREYSLVDDSVRELMIAVKKWAKDNKVCSAQDNTLSSYAWICMVIFYLQCISYIPNLQCPKLMEKAGFQRDPEDYWHDVSDLNTCYSTWEQVQKVWKRPEVFGDQPHSCTALLYGFFHFYTHDFSRSTSMISIKRGRDEVLPKTTFRKCSDFFCIEDPFETVDSHMPHDLGIPVNEAQCPRILLVLRNSEEHLRFLLLGGCNDEDDIPWPTASATKVKKKKVGNRGRGEGGGAPVVNKKEKKKAGETPDGKKKNAKMQGDSIQPKKNGQIDDSQSNNRGEHTKGSKKNGQNDGTKPGAGKLSNKDSGKDRKGVGSNRDIGKGGRGRGGRGGGRHRGGRGERHGRKDGKEDGTK